MCRQLNTSPTPATEELLCIFVAYLALNDITVSTIKVYLSGVRQLHVQEGRPPPPTTEMARLMQVLRGIKISQAASHWPNLARQRLPITPEILRKVKARCSLSGQDHALGCISNLFLWLLLVGRNLLKPGRGVQPSFRSISG